MGLCLQGPFRNRTIHGKERVQYKEMYAESVADPEGFWGKIASDFHWEQKVCSLAMFLQHVPESPLPGGIVEPTSTHQSTRAGRRGCCGPRRAPMNRPKLYTLDRLCIWQFHAK